MRSADWYRERRGRVSLPDADKAVIATDYNVVTGGDFRKDFKPTCPNRYSDAIDKILYIMSNKERSGYVLKGGIVVKFQGKRYSRSNITKEAAEAYIAENLDRRNDFEVLAKNWEDYEVTATRKPSVSVAESES